MIVNHVGLRVGDLDASARFYEALGFTEAMSMDVDDEAAHLLLRVAPPLGLRAVYLTNGPFVLELLGFSEHPAAPADRSMTETGLTHLSLGVDDMALAKKAVAQHGGQVLDDTDLGVAVMVRDPDGQLIELLDSARRPVTPES
jgi:lactoylglutathione lyase